MFANSLCVRMTLGDDKKLDMTQSIGQFQDLTSFAERRLFTKVLYSLNHLMPDQQTVL